MKKRRVSFAIILPSLLMLAIAAFQNCDGFNGASLLGDPKNSELLSGSDRGIEVPQSGGSDVTFDYRQISSVFLEQINMVREREGVYRQSLGVGDNGQMLSAPQLTGDKSVWADFDGDGVRDILSIESVKTDVICDDGKPVFARSAVVLSGRNLERQLTKTGILNDNCVPINGGKTELVIGLYRGSLQFGLTPNLAVLVPQYYSTSWFLSAVSSNGFYTPNSASFELYSNAKQMLQPSASGKKWQYGTAPPNGLIIRRNEVDQYVSATSGRFLIYSNAALASSQLVNDIPFLARQDLVGRSYGLIQHDRRGNPAMVSLIAGTGMNDLYSDLIEVGSQRVVAGHDRWGGIERHVTTLNLESNTVEQAFVSYAHDKSNENAYVDRIAYPANAFLPTKSGSGSRIVYNHFDGSSWSVVVTRPGSIAVEMRIRGFVVWDIVRLPSGDADLIVSPIDSLPVSLPNRLSDSGTVLDTKLAEYLPKFETRIWRWNSSDQSYKEVRMFPNVVPKLDVAFPHTSSSGTGTGSLFQAQKLWDFEAGALVILGTTDRGLPFEMQLPGN